MNERDGRVVQRGRWLYGGTVEAGVEIRRSWVAWGSGDYEDPPEIREDHDTPCFYVWWSSPGDEQRLSRGGGPFASIGDARAHAESQSGGTLRWIGEGPFFCPRCGDTLQHHGPKWTCAAGEMELSPQMAADLRACFVEKTQTPPNTTAGVRLCSRWFCPGCGAVMREADTGVRCPSCGRALDPFIFRLVDLHPHRAVRPPDDGLTGLPTRHALKEHLNDLLGNRAEATLPMLFVDIDGLVWITDWFGYASSDEAIQRIAKWLVGLAHPERGRVFRVGGDEFLLVFQDVSQEAVQAIGQRIVDECPTLGIPYERPNDARKVTTVSAIAFSAGADFADGIREVTKQFAQALYEAEVKVNRNHSVFIALDPS